MLSTISAQKTTLLFAFAVVLATLTVAVVGYQAMPPAKRRKGPDNDDTSDTKGSVSVAFLGNSILYFNDCPRLVQNMLETCFVVHQDSCLRGGASLVSLLTKGNGMKEKFNAPTAVRKDGSRDIGAATVTDLLSNRPWDFVVMNDHTQGPVRQATKEATLAALESSYATLIQESGATPVLLQTFSYKKENMKGTEDLGSFADFSVRLQAGYDDYAHLLTKLIPDRPCRIARVGEAVLWLHQYNHDLWDKLYSWDEFHPSPSGTWLEACCIYCAVTNKVPPALDSQWWESARRMQPADEKPMALPTDEEADDLRRVACLVSNVSFTTTTSRL